MQRQGSPFLIAELKNEDSAQLTYKKISSIFKTLIAYKFNSHKKFKMKVSFVLNLYSRFYALRR